MNIVFDIGNVLVRWDPHLAFLPVLGTREKVDAYLKKIDFAMLNLRGDAGESFADLATTIADPEDRAIFETYLPNYARTIAEPVEGTWVLMQRLRENGHAIHAITNWSAETWPIGVACHPRGLGRGSGGQTRFADLCDALPAQRRGTERLPVHRRQCKEYRRSPRLWHGGDPFHHARGAGERTCRAVLVIDRPCKTHGAAAARSASPVQLTGYPRPSVNRCD
jgi:hypothetical protein